jgi:hypothetical protein
VSLPVVYHPVYEDEWRALPPAERVAMATAVAKLRVDGHLGFPHTSLARGGALGVRELRPRRGRSPWRGLYRRVGGALVMLAVAPEAMRDRRGFEKALAAAEARLREVEE